MTEPTALDAAHVELLFRSLDTADRRLRRQAIEVAAIADSGLDTSAVRMLLRLNFEFSGEARQQLLAESLMQAASHVSRTLAALELRGLVERGGSAPLQRGTVARVTAAGDALARVLDERVTATLSGLIRDWRAREVRDTTRLIGRIAQGARRGANPTVALFVTIQRAARTVRERRIDAAVAERVAVDLGPLELRIWLALGEQPDLERRPRALAEQLVTALPNISTALARMEGRGLIERRTASFDGRARIVTLSGAARAPAAEARTLRAEMLGALVSKWSESELERASSLLGRLVGALETPRPGPAR